MKVLLVHNRYREAGGEDGVFAAEKELLRGGGHQVIEYARDNNEIALDGLVSRVCLAANTLWARESLRDLREIIAREKPDVAHFHNTFPLISPSAYYACAEAGVPVVQTLHNYRLICPAATFLRDGKVCEDCLGRSVAWPGVVHGCYRGNRAATSAVAAMLAVHRAMGTWREKVEVYIAMTEFARGKFIEGGLPEERIVVKPNFVSGDFAPRTQPGNYALFVGRLSEEKGPHLLPPAWRLMRARIPLGIVGDGPLLEKLSREVKDSSLPQIELTGRCTPEEVRSLMLGARFLVFPSICFENLPMTVIEAFACGRPVIASRLGAMEEIVEDGRTGLHFAPGEPEDLAAKVEWAWSHPEEMREMGKAARAEYEAKYTAERNYKMLMEIYGRALRRAC